MSAEKVIYYLMSSDTELLKKVPKTRIYPSLIPLGTTLTCNRIYVSIHSRTNCNRPELQIDRRSRVQITVAATSYPQVKQIMALVEAACNHKQGTF